jgi:hypothetical protein
MRNTTGAAAPENKLRVKSDYIEYSISKSSNNSSSSSSSSNSSSSKSKRSGEDNNC